jgi:hypothetical protein
VHQKRNACLNNSTHVVDMCVYFASDYNYIIPFLAHHFALGFHKIFIYNNDENVQWYNHPAVLCFLEHEMIEIQPWFGENALMKGLDHCYFSRIEDNYKYELTNEVPKPYTLPAKPVLWGANFDIDEMLVLHQHQCIGNFVEKYEAPSIALNWAFFTPEYPMTKFGRTANTAYLPQEHRDLVHYRKTNKHEGILLPHEMLLRRMHENKHIKTINRIECADHWENEHCPQYKATCPFGSKAVDPQGHFIKCTYFTPWIDNNYPIAQLNHYWTLSLADFLRKIHRGKGGSYAKNTDNFRSTGEFFRHGHIKEGFVNDTIMITKYGPFFDQLKDNCPKCFDLSYYHLVN